MGKHELYGSRRSGSLAVELALAEIGIAYELREVNLDSAAQRGEEYAAVNAQRKLPALVTPDGAILTESVAILLTLDERNRDAALLPAPGSAARAQALRWLLFIATEIYPMVEINDYPERFAMTPDGASAMRELARAKWRERWLLVEAAIAGTPYLLPTGFCLTDIYIAVVSRWAQQDSWRASHLPKVEALTAAVAARAACADVWQRHCPDDIPAHLTQTG